MGFLSTRCLFVHSIVSFRFRFGFKIQSQVNAPMNQNKSQSIPENRNGKESQGGTDSKVAEGKPPRTLAEIIMAQFADLQKYHAAALDSDEVEAIHKLRVTTRKLQASLDLLEIGEDKKGIGKLKKRLRNLRRKLSEVRNYDVFLILLEQEAADRGSLHYPFESLKRELKHRRKVRSAKIRKPIQSVKIDDFAKSLGLSLKPQEDHPGKADDEAQSQSLSLAHIADHQAILQHTADRIDQRLDEFLLLARQALPTTHPEELHQLRIAAKRLRYLLELASETGYDGSVAALNWLRALQDRIGDWHDLEAIEAEIINIVSRKKFIARNLFEASSILSSAVHLQKKKLALVKRIFPLKVHRNLASTSKRVAKALRQASQ
jgi:CHAD domain-containing protein